MLKDALREKSDVFNSENPEEDKVSVYTQVMPLLCWTLLYV
jgi:hypothetical protein